MFANVLSFLSTNTPLAYLTQSLWRDEAFSYFVATQSFPAGIIQTTARDFNPPLYYLLLRIWIELFGNSVVAMRSLSLVAFVLLVIIVYLLARKLFSSGFAVIITTLLTLTNPMLVYFAFELRMYSLLALFVTVSMYALVEQKRLLYTIAVAAGLYTHPFMAFAVFAQVVYLAATGRLRQSFRPLLAAGVLFAPWIPVLLQQFAASSQSWIWPVDAQLIRAVIGNLYVGYEGTPPHLWPVLTVLSGVFVAMTLLVLTSKRRKQALLLTTWVFVPTAAVIGISLVKPIYVHRYLIYVAVGEVLLVGAVLQRFHSLRMARIAGVVFLLFFAGVNIYAAPFHRKVDFAGTFARIKQLQQPGDIILADNPLNYFESRYYAPDSSQVFLYNPKNVELPVYVGAAGMPRERWMNDFPQLPQRAFLVHNDGSFETVSTP